MVLQFFNDEIKSDRDVVLAAVKQYGYALEYTCDALKNDKELVLFAVTQDGSAIRHASEILKNDKEVVLAALKGERCYVMDIFRYACCVNPTFKDDMEVALTALNNDPRVISLVSPSVLSSHAELLSEVIKHYGPALEHASETQKNNEDIVRQASEK